MLELTRDKGSWREMKAGTQKSGGDIVYVMCGGAWVITRPLFLASDFSSNNNPLSSP
jgi:hypothetical protein